MGSGTWHLQLQGSKVWMLRPTSELVRKNRALRGAKLRVLCEEGDVLCINTRLWWHKTHIPGCCPLSLSVARDMYLDDCTPTDCNMTNVEGHYATRTISAGTTIFTEDNAPDLGLPSSPNSNCGLREAPDGKLIVIAKRRIPAGEWFAVSESEDEAACHGPKRKRTR